MKKTILFAFAILMLTACVGKNGEKSETVKLTSGTDSVVGVDTVGTDSQLVAEPKAPIDSIPQYEKTEPLTISTFCKWDSSEKLMTTLSANQVKKKLTGLNFTEHSSKLTYKGVNDASGENIKIYKVKYSREANGELINVELEYIQSQYGQFLTEVEIKFPNSELKDAFMKTALNNHFKKTSGNVYSGHPEDIYWMGSEIEVKGNTVEIKELSEA